MTIFSMLMNLNELQFSTACQSVPISVTGFKCTSCGQCSRQYIPLTLAYARTIHKFQGQSAGPVDAGKIPNVFECIVCDPDENQYEGKALGLLYTAVSRATTLGDDDGRNSAIYFTGDSMKNGDRIRCLGKKKNSMDDFVNIARRERWVQHLRHNTKTFTKSKNHQKSILKWAESKQYSYDTLYNRINQYTEAFSNSN